ncbi:MAG: phosphotransferase [Proteobacteria bacterium]|nr:phosphotransferase [Pseudomonadota bacterium]
MPLAIRGSDRNFFRMTWGDKDSAILIQYNPNRLENTYYADIAVFLCSIHIPVPLMISHDPAACLMLMEDVGERDLWSLRDTSWETRQGLYQKTLSIAHRLHSFPESDFPQEHVRLMDGFDLELYCWEQNYFRENFVSGVCGIDMKASIWQEIEAELSALARRLIGTGHSLIHRDLQSQNVMIRDGEPFLIDFQGMRFGSPFYDIGSLLCDPYVRFSEAEVEDLLLFYYRLSKQVLDWPDFRNTFWEASAQRLMQALGAYGFLGLMKGVTAFLEHIPAGLMNLQRAVSHTATLTRLRELIDVCQRQVELRNILPFR